MPAAMYQDLPEVPSGAAADGDIAQQVVRAGSGADAGDDVLLVSEADRLDAIARAQIWRQPAPAVGDTDFAPPAAKLFECRFTVTQLGGTTPKFHCLLPSGKQLRVKYGFAPEVPAETAATRLLAALGLAADHVTLAERVRCYGCPREPFTTMKVVEVTHTGGLYEHAIDHAKYEEFEWAALEDKFAARAIESETQKGWAFFELDRVDPAKGGAPRDHVDALRLLAVFLAHWDNKSENQRLVCPHDAVKDGARCRQPLLMLQDVGATFGPTKLNLDAWEKAAIWEDRATCTITMKDMPYGGGTFGHSRVSERGRRFLAGLLGQLNDLQLTDLFSAARVDQPRIPWSTTRPVEEWVRVFKRRVSVISEGAACPEP